MKIYDYNQEFGGNYYQPMIDYLNTKVFFFFFFRSTLRKLKSILFYKGFIQKQLISDK
jgi:hypothetical protein